MFSDFIYSPFRFMNYQTYEKLRQILFPLGSASFGVGISSNQPGFIGFSFLTMCFNLFLYDTKTFLNLKDVRNLLPLLEEFLDHYHEFNQTFELTNPMEIFFLYSYLLNHGYFSYNHEYQFFNDTKTHSALFAMYPFTGKSCCRHEAKLLSEILKREGIDSSILINFKTETSLDEEVFDLLRGFLPDPKYLLQNGGLPNVYNFLNLEVEKFRNMGIFREDAIHVSEYPKNPTEANHCITIARADGISYYLDPTNDRIYRKCMVDGEEVLVYGYALCIPRTSKKFKSVYQSQLEDIHHIKEILSGINATLEAELNARRKVQKITEANQDLLEKFYQENAPIYKEITNGLQLIRKNK